MKKLLLIALINCFQVLGKTINEEEIRKLPKAELHLHLGGAYPITYLKSISTPQKFKELLSSIEKFVTGINYDQSFFVFKLVSQIVNTYQKVEDGTYALCKELQKDGVEYVEIRTGLGDGNEEYLQAILRGIDRAINNNFKANILISIKRFSSPEWVRKMINIALRYKAQGVIGIDISNNSVKGDVKQLLPILVDAKKRGLSFVVHMGESPFETDQILLIQHLHPSRIGHGIYLKPKVLEFIRKHKIPIEVCLSSSKCLKLISKYKSHPGLNLYAEGHPIIICTDDPLIFRTTLTKEYAHFAKEMSISIDELKNVAIKSFSYRLNRS